MGVVLAIALDEVCVLCVREVVWACRNRLVVDILMCGFVVSDFNVCGRVFIDFLCDWVDFNVCVGVGVSVGVVLAAKKADFKQYEWVFVRAQSRVVNT